MKTVCVVTGTRAEYGLLKRVMTGVSYSSQLKLQVVVTGMHLSPEFGLTVNHIIEDGFIIDRKVEMLLSSDTPTGITKSLGIGLIGFADAFSDLSPDLVLLLGDRYEIMAAAIAALIARVPIAHLHGGEVSMGVIDESIRHSITKMSHLHFVATEEYRQRVIQLGEAPDTVFKVGGLGVDAIQQTSLMDREELESDLGFEFKKRNLLITFHPVTLDESSSRLQMIELLRALKSLRDTQLIFTMPNSDTDGRVLFQLINRFVAEHSNACAFTSLGQLRYLSCVNQVDAVLGNSSSGLTEVPSFKKATINIGDRQDGRLKAISVVDCAPTTASIQNALKEVYSDEFQEILLRTDNPYGSGGASQLIVENIEKVELTNVIKKKFFDLDLRTSHFFEKAMRN